MTASTDRIELCGLRARGHHGVLPTERSQGQVFVVDLVLVLDTAPAAVTDDLALTVDYGALAERVVADVGRDPVDLIETLAARLAALVLEDDAVDAVEVTVHKPAAPIPVPFDDVAVTVRRSAARTAVGEPGGPPGSAPGRAG